MARAPAFAGNPLDRADQLRSDPERLADLRRAESARLLVLDGLAPLLDAQDRLTWSTLDDVSEETEIVFLGLQEGAAVFALVPPAGDTAPAYAQRASWEAIGRLGLDELALYGGARSLVDWHARHRFCANCGQPTRLTKGGWQRNCVSCAAQHFPRVDPVAIMLVEHDGPEGRALLLGRQSRFPPRSYSALAGFIEPGETVEEAVAREVFEEAGVVVRDVTYIASQPWPFPSQLMIGCHGFAEQRDLVIDKTELEDARWFTRDEVAEALAKGQDSASFRPPPRRAIAHHMLEWWLERE